MVASTDYAASHRLALTGDWRIGRLEPHRAQLAAALQPPVGGIELDGTEITHIDTLGLQLLAVFVQQCQRQQVSVKWTGAGSLLQEGAARLGLNAIMALPDQAPA